MSRRRLAALTSAAAVAASAALAASLAREGSNREFRRTPASDSSTDITSHAAPPGGDGRHSMPKSSQDVASSNASSVAQRVARSSHELQARLSRNVTSAVELASSAVAQATTTATASATFFELQTILKRSGYKVPSLVEMYKQERDFQVLVTTSIRAAAEQTPLRRSLAQRDSGRVMDWLCSSLLSRDRKVRGEAERAIAAFLGDWDTCPAVLKRPGAVKALLTWATREQEASEKHGLAPQHSHTTGLSVRRSDPTIGQSGSSVLLHVLMDLLTSAAEDRMLVAGSTSSGQHDSTSVQAHRAEASRRLPTAHPHTSSRPGEQLTQHASQQWVPHRLVSPEASPADVAAALEVLIHGEIDDAAGREEGSKDREGSDGSKVLGIGMSIGGSTAVVPAVAMLPARVRRVEGDGEALGSLQDADRVSASAPQGGNRIKKVTRQEELVAAFPASEETKPGSLQFRQVPPDQQALCGAAAAAGAKRVRRGAGAGEEGSAGVYFVGAALCESGQGSRKQSGADILAGGRDGEASPGREQGRLDGEAAAQGDSWLGWQSLWPSSSSLSSSPTPTTTSTSIHIAGWYQQQQGLGSTSQVG